MNPVTLTDEAMARIEGAYFREDLAIVLRVQRDKGGLRLSLGGRPLEMIHTGYYGVSGWENGSKWVSGGATPSAGSRANRPASRTVPAARISRRYPGGYNVR